MAYVIPDSVTIAASLFMLSLPFLCATQFKTEKYLFAKITYLSVKYGIYKKAYTVIQCSEKVLRHLLN